MTPYQAKCKPGIWTKSQPIDRANKTNDAQRYSWRMVTHTLHAWKLVQPRLKMALNEYINNMLGNFYTQDLL